MISSRAILNFWSFYISLIWLKIFSITSQAILKCRNKICLTVSGSKINLMLFRYMNQWIHLKLMWHLLFLLNKFSKYHLYPHSEHLHFFSNSKLRSPAINKPLQPNEFSPFRIFWSSLQTLCFLILPDLDTDYFSLALCLIIFSDVCT